MRDELIGREINFQLDDLSRFRVSKRNRHYVLIHVIKVQIDKEEIT